MKKWFALLYDMLVILLALVSVMASFLELAEVPVASKYWFDVMEICIQLFFLCDYVIRFIHAKEKKSFFMENIPELVALFPYVYALRFFRFARLFHGFHALHALGAMSHMHQRAKSFWNQNGLLYVLYLFLIVWGFCATGIYVLEKGTTVKSYGDALWWSFITATTLGGNAPITVRGRLLVVLDIVAGLAFLTCFTGNLVTSYLKRNEKITADKMLGELSPKEKKHMLLLLQAEENETRKTETEKAEDKR
jgi:voltage-gated potassium channel